MFQPAPLAMHVAPKEYRMHTPPALLVASASEVDASVTAAIGNLGSKESQRSYECAWRFYREWLTAQGLDVTAVRPKHIVQYLEKLKADGQVKASIGRALTVIRSIYARVVTDEHMPTNPAREVKGPKVDGSVPKAPYIDKEEDLEKLLNVPAGTWTELRDRLIVRMTFGLGWRRAEVARARVEHIEDESITAIVKGGKRLTVGLPDWLADDIAEWRRYAGIDAGPLFPRRPDDPRPITGAIIIYRIVKQACKKAGITVIPPHGLRRTNITLGGKRGLTLKERQLSVGHSSSSTTERYDRARDARANKTGNVFKDLVRK